MKAKSGIYYCQPLTFVLLKLMDQVKRAADDARDQLQANGSHLDTQDTEKSGSLWKSSKSPPPPQFLQLFISHELLANQTRLKSLRSIQGSVVAWAAVAEQIACVCLASRLWLFYSDVIYLRLLTQHNPTADSNNEDHFPPSCICYKAVLSHSVKLSLWL